MKFKMISSGVMLGNKKEGGGGRFQNKGWRSFKKVFLKFDAYQIKERCND
jgi:hypothetical protein